MALTIKANSELSHRTFGQYSLYGITGNNTIFIVEPERTWLFVRDLKYKNVGSNKTRMCWLSCVQNHIIVKSFDFKKEFNNEKINPKLLAYTTKPCDKNTYDKIMCLVMSFEKIIGDIPIKIDQRLICHEFGSHKLYGNPGDKNVGFIDSNGISWLLVWNFKYMDFDTKKQDLCWLSFANTLIVKSFDFQNELYNKQIDPKLISFDIFQCNKIIYSQIQDILIPFKKEAYRQSMIKCIGEEKAHRWVNRVNWKKMAETPVPGYDIDGTLPSEILTLIARYLKRSVLMCVSKNWHNVIFTAYHKCNAGLCDVKLMKIDLYGVNYIVPEQCQCNAVKICSWCNTLLPHHVKIRKCSKCMKDLIYGHACRSTDDAYKNYVSPGQELTHVCAVDAMNDEEPFWRDHEACIVVHTTNYNWNWNYSDSDDYYDSDSDDFQLELN